MLLVKMGPVSSRFVAVNYLAPLTRLPAITENLLVIRNMAGADRACLSQAASSCIMWHPRNATNLELFSNLFYSTYLVVCNSKQ